MTLILRSHCNIWNFLYNLLNCAWVLKPNHYYTLLKNVKYLYKSQIKSVSLWWVTVYLNQFYNYILFFNLHNAMLIILSLKGIFLCRNLFSQTTKLPAAWMAFFDQHHCNVQAHANSTIYMYDLSWSVRLICQNTP